MVKLLESIIEEKMDLIRTINFTNWEIDQSIISLKDQIEDNKDYIKLNKIRIKELEKEIEELKGLNKKK